MLLVSSRPALCRAPGQSELDWVLPEDVRQTLGIEEWRFPAFYLHAEPDAAARIDTWVGGSQGQGSASASSSASLIVCVSPGSLDLLAPLLPHPWPHHLFLGLMGDGSARKAEALGFPPQALIYPSMQRGESQDSEGLLALLAKRPPFAHMLLLKGNGGNLDLAPALRGLCPALEVLQAYRRVPADAVSVSVLGAQLMARLQSPSQPAQPGLHPRVSGPGLTPPNGSAAMPPLVFYLTSSEAVDVLTPILETIRPHIAAVVTTHARIQARAAQLAWPSPECILPGASALEQRLRALLHAR